MTDLAFLGIADAAEMIRARKLSPVEYTQALLDRTTKLAGRYHAYIRLTPDVALAAARQAESEIMAGRWKGPLHGVPFALKDIIDAVGLPTTAHSKVLIDNVAAADAPVAARLKAAGSVMMGKLATHEFAIGGPSFDLPWPPAVNPWGGRHFPGGSSSGSGVALACGMVPAALGTDTGGSVRNPASMCGITGLKPTYGRVSRRGVLPLAYSLDHVGPMTRTVRDNALLLQILAGHDPEDPGSADVAVPDYAADLDRGVKGLKLGLVRHFYTTDMQAHPEQAQAIERAAEILRELGAEVREIRLEPLEDYAACTRLIIRCEAYAIHRRWLAERPGDYGELARQRILDGAAVSAADYIDALRMRARLIADAGPAHAPHARRLRRHRCGIDGLEHGPDLPHRRCRGELTRLSAPGPPALQRHGPAGHRHSRRVHQGRAAAVAADRRAPLPGGHGLPRRPSLRTRHRLDRAPPARPLAGERLKTAPSAQAAAFTAWPLTTSWPPLTVTLTFWPSRMVPARICSASGSCTYFWITRFRGLAP
jgi:aspartyl-tRNA(Asn)/glutamyl-tRNA(Gln) amidotransferase subunit A